MIFYDRGNPAGISGIKAGMWESNENELVISLFAMMGPSRPSECRTAAPSKGLVKPCPKHRALIHKL